MGSDARNAAARAGSTGGYRRRFGESELLLPEPHALEPGVGLLEAPAVITLEHIGDGEHQIERTAVVTTAGDGGALQGVGELEELELDQPVALLKGGEGVVLLVGRQLTGGARERRGRPGGCSWPEPADHRQQGGQEGQTETEEGEQKESREALKGSDIASPLLVQVYA